MQESIRIAVLGAGQFGTLHARTLAGLPEAQLVAIGDADPKRAQTLADELGVKSTFTDLGEFLKNEKVDGIVIATRTSTHVPLAQIALDAGIAVLVEKPVAENSADISQLLQHPNAHRAMAGHICLFHSLIDPLLQRVQNEGFRTIHLARHRPSWMCERFPEEHPIRMTMVHDLYVLAQMVCGEEPESFEARQSKNANGQIDCSWATLRWRDGRVATLESHWLVPAGGPSDGWDCTEIFGDNYHAIVDTNPAPLVWTNEKAEWPQALEIGEIAGRPVGMLAEELRSFIALCRGKSAPAGCRLEDALQLQQWMEKLLASAAGQR
jgi:predicted dehydrogenase